MLSNEFIRFLRDERGSYTIWSLLWFIMYVAIGGLAVDITDVFRNQNWLQATADSAALAGVMSLGVPGEDPVKAALTYSLGNMRPGTHGAVLNDEEVVLGTWSFSQERFYSGTSDPNAVYVTTRRGEQNGNPLAWSLLRILSMGGVDPWWNVKAEAVAVKGVGLCHNNGMIALADLDFKTHTEFYNDMCLIGHNGFKHRDNGMYFADGVYVGVGCEAGDNGCIGPSENVAFKNDSFKDAFGVTDGNPHYKDPTLPLNAMKVDNYIEALIDFANPLDGTVYTSFDHFLNTYEGSPGVDYSGYEYLVQPDTRQTLYYNGPTLPSTLTPYTVYDIDCDDSGWELPAGTYENVAVIVDCPLSLNGGGGGDGPAYKMSNTLIGSTFTGSTHAIHANANVDFGADGCSDGVELYSLGRVHFAASGNLTGVRLLAQDDIKFAAKPNGMGGVHFETTGQLFQASGSAHKSMWGNCPDTLKNGPQVLTYSLVR